MEKRMRLPIWLAAGVFLSGSIIGGAWPEDARAAGEFTAGQKTAVEKIVHDYLIANPEVVREAIEELDRRQKADEANQRGKVVSDKAATLFNSVNQAVVGNPKGDVTLVEFFDYNCGYCKRSVNTVAKLIEGDPKLRVVLKDFAILGPDSVEAALVANAARMQFSPEKFWEFHRKLLETKGHIGKQQAMAVARDVGADMTRLEKDFDKPETKAALQEVSGLADALRFDGTPAWVVGGEALVGGVPFDELKKKIDSMHQCGKTAC
jgi:protein-disulfide isomerase